VAHPNRLYRQKVDIRVVINDRANMGFTGTFWPDQQPQRFHHSSAQAMLSIVPP